MFALPARVVCAWCAGVTEKHFKEKLPRVLGLGNTTPDAATMTTGVRGLMFGDYMVPGMPALLMKIICILSQQASGTCNASQFPPDRLV